MILKLWCQFIEITAPAPNPDNQIRMIFRMFLHIQKLLSDRLHSIAADACPRQINSRTRRAVFSMPSQFRNTELCSSKVSGPPLIIFRISNLVKDFITDSTHWYGPSVQEKNWTHRGQRPFGHRQ